MTDTELLERLIEWSGVISRGYRSKKVAGIYSVGCGCCSDYANLTEEEQAELDGKSDIEILKWIFEHKVKE